jgi:uncharacterized protein YutE (UPF0331/DUF86 family)
MTPTGIREEVVTERTSWIRRMLQGLEDLPLETKEAFLSDPKNVAAAESYLRRSLEALLDLGRHILAKGFGYVASEYKEIATGLVKQGIVSADNEKRIRNMAGYRNRMVHFYDEIAADELYELSRDGAKDIAQILDLILVWLSDNPDRIGR